MKPIVTEGIYHYIPYAGDAILIDDVPFYIPIDIIPMGSKIRITVEVLD